jgi:hypothetical protein
MCSSRFEAGIMSLSVAPGADAPCYLTLAGIDETISAISNLPVSSNGQARFRKF